MKILTLGAELFHGDGRKPGQTDRQTDTQTYRHTDMTDLIVTFCNFAKKHKN